MARDIGPRIGIEGEAEYRRAINEITQSQKTLSAEMERTASAFDKNASAQAKSAAKAKTLKQQISQQEKKVQELARMTEMSTQKTGENSVATLKWKEALANAETQLNKLNAELKKNSKLSAFGEDLQTVGRGLQSAGGTMKSVGTTFTKYVSAPIIAAGAVAVKSASDFETAIAKVSTIADTTQTPIDDLRESILNLSDETGIAATDLAESVYNAISAGQETGAAVDFVETTAKLARAGFTSTEDALSVLTSIMNAYGLEAEQAGEVSDKLITIQNRGKTTIGELASSMGKLIPTSAAFGVNLDQISSAYVVMTKNGISTAESTTYMNSMFNELGKSGTKASKVIQKRTGKSFKQLMDDGDDLVDVLEILKTEADESGLSLADMFGSAEAGKAALSIMADDGKEFTASMAAMGQAAGSAQKAFETMSGTSAMKMQNALNKLKNTGIEVGATLLDMAGPGIDLFGEKISQIGEWYKNLDEETKDMVSKVGVSLGVGGPLLSSVGEMVSGVGKGVETVGKLFTGLASKIGTSSPFGMAAAALAGLTIAWVFTPIERSEGYEEFMAGMSELDKEIQGIAEKSAEIGTSLSESIANVDTKIEPLQALYDKLAECYDENGNLKSGMEETASYMVGEFDKQMGTDFSSQFGQNAQANIDALQGMKKELQSYVELLKQSAIQQAFNERYGEVIENEANATIKREEAQSAYNATIEEENGLLGDLAQKNAAINREMERSGQVDPMRMWELTQIENDLDDATAKREAAAKELIKAAGAEETATQQTKLLNQAMGELASGNTEKAAKTMATAGEVAEKAGKSFMQKLIPGLSKVTPMIKKFKKNAYLEDIEPPKLEKADVKPTIKQLKENFEKEFKKNSPTLSLRNSKILGATEKGNETKSTIERTVSNLKGRVGGINNTTGAATGAWNEMQSIVGRGMKGRISEVVGGKLAAFAAISEAQATADANPIVIRTVQSSSSGGGFLSGLASKFANGDIVNTPTYGVFGEAGPEAIIPLSGGRRNRAMSLYRRVGNILGVGGGSNSTTNNNNVNINVYAQPGQSVDEIANAVSRRINAQVYRKGAVFA